MVTMTADVKKTKIFLLQMEASGFAPSIHLLRLSPDELELNGILLPKILHISPSVIGGLKDDATDKGIITTNDKTVCITGDICEN